MWDMVFAQEEAAGAQVAGDGAGQSAQGFETIPGTEDAPADAPQRSTNPFGGMLPMLVMIFAIFYFFMIRPNQKREKERREMLAALSKGDKVVTTGGICGTIVGLSEKSVVVRVSEEPTVKMEFLRGAVTQVASQGAGGQK